MARRFGISRARRSEWSGTAPEIQVVDEGAKAQFGLLPLARGGGGRASFLLLERNR